MRRHWICSEWMRSKPISSTIVVGLNQKEMYCSTMATSFLPGFFLLVKPALFPFFATALLGDRREMYCCAAEISRDQGPRLQAFYLRLRRSTKNSLSPYSLLHDW